MFHEKPGTNKKTRDQKPNKSPWRCCGGPAVRAAQRMLHQIGKLLRAGPKGMASGILLGDRCTIHSPFHSDRANSDHNARCSGGHQKPTAVVAVARRRSSGDGGEGSNRLNLSQNGYERPKFDVARKQVRPNTGQKPANNLVRKQGRPKTGPKWFITQSVLQEFESTCHTVSSTRVRIN
jgi:hypothetical protein